MNNKSFIAILMGYIRFYQLLAKNLDFLRNYF